MDVMNKTIGVVGVMFAVMMMTSITWIELMMMMMMIFLMTMFLIKNWKEQQVCVLQ